MISQVKQSIAVVDIDAASGTSAEVFKAPFAGYLDVSGCYAVYTEAPGTQTGVRGVISIEVDGDEVATHNCIQGGDIGDAGTFSPDGTNATTANPHVQFDAGDTITLKTKTEATGGTTDGEARIHLALRYGA